MHFYLRVLSFLQTFQTFKRVPPLKELGTSLRQLVSNQLIPQLRGILAHLKAVCEQVGIMDLWTTEMLNKLNSGGHQGCLNPYSKHKTCFVFCVSQMQV